MGDKELGKKGEYLVAAGRKAQHLNTHKYTSLIRQRADMILNYHRW